MCILILISLQFGILRFCGPTDFASGEWAGVELDTPIGKNDGSVGGVFYFQCQPKRGKLTRGIEICLAEINRQWNFLKSV